MCGWRRRYSLHSSQLMLTLPSRSILRSERRDGVEEGWGENGGRERVEIDGGRAEIKGREEGGDKGREEGGGRR